MTTVVPVLSSGVAPQHAVISRALISPELVLGGGPYDNDNDFNCPPGVPLFTTEVGLGSMQKPARKGRDTGRDFIIPVIFNVPPGREDFIFVGVSYGAATRKQPIVSMATAGLVSIPIDKPAPEGAPGGGISFRRSTGPYGSADGPFIGLVSDGKTPPITNSTTRAITAYSIQRSGSHDITVLLGTPPRATLKPLQVESGEGDEITNPDGLLEA